MARRRLAAWILAIAPAVAACAHSATPTPVTPPVQLTLTRFRTEASSYLSFSGYTTPTTLVIRDRQQWQSAWTQMYVASPTSLPPPLPDVDFSREMVLLAAAGNQPSSGYDVIFDSAMEAEGVVTVDVTARRPGNCGVLTVITSPVDLARLPKRDGRVVFRTSPVTMNCR